MSRRRRAFSLIELILALGLTVVLISLISSTVFIYSRAVDSGRWEVAEAQLARNILRRMAEDLRSSVYPQELSDYKTARNLIQQITNPNAASSAKGPTDAANVPPVNSDSKKESEDSMMPDLSEDPDENAPVEVGPAPPSGLHGTQYRLEVDVSRIPRLDEHQGLVSGSSSPSDLVSDVKSIAYFMRNAAYSSGTTEGTSSSGAAAQEGLVRRQLDRAAAVWATQNGEMGERDQQAEVLAPEVTAIEFRYFDGSEWMTEWDSKARGGLPLMVEISLTIPRPASTQTAGDRGILADPDDEANIYRMLVHLPLAATGSSSMSGPISDEPIEEGGAAGDEEDAGTDSGAGQP